MKIHQMLTSKKKLPHFSRSSKFSIIIGATKLFVCFSVLFLSSQTEETEEEINLQMIELREKIQELQSELKEEKKYFEQFEKEKKSILNAKKQEQENLNEEIKNRTQKISTLKRNFYQIQEEIDQLKNHNKVINQLIQNQVEKLITSIEKGVPFEIEKRKSALSSLLIDLKTSEISPSESFNRLVTFLNSEEALGYDSQVLRVVIPFKGVSQEVNLIRIGLIFFAVEINNEIYLYHRTQEGYRLDEKPLSLFKAQSVRKAIEIIQGKRPPELIPISIDQAIWE